MVRIHLGPPDIGPVAQLGERLICIQEVRSSILLRSTNSTNMDQSGILACPNALGHALLFDNCIASSRSFRLQFLSSKLWSSYKGLMVDDLAQIGDEGRGKLR